MYSNFSVVYIAGIFNIPANIFKYIYISSKFSVVFIAGIFNIPGNIFKYVHIYSKVVFVGLP